MKGWQLARPDILTLKAYRAAEQQMGTIRLNANEAPQPLRGDAGSAPLNRYPEVHPEMLARKMSALFEVTPEQILVTRGSSEAIDVLVRSFCTAYEHNIVTLAPSFEMYRFYADVQGVELRTKSLTQENDFSIDANAILGLCDEQTRLVMLCSPNNPTGTPIAGDDVLEIAAAVKNHAIVVVDEAYVEFSNQTSLARQTSSVDNLVILRTLSKAHALAGARCGAAVACDDMIDVMRRVLPPYSFPTPVIERVMRILDTGNDKDSQNAIAKIVAERQRLSDELRQLQFVDSVWDSEANFILARFRNFESLLSYLGQKKILIRSFNDEPELSSCARITIGSSDENDALLAALREFEVTQ